MNNYRYLNLNPDGLDTQDCTIRAISLFLDISWDDAYWGVVTEGFLQKKMPSTDAVWGRYLEKNNCYLTRVPSDCPLCYTVKDFAKDFNKGRYLLKVNEHVVTVINGYYYDTWNSGNEIVLYYWKRR